MPQYYFNKIMDKRSSDIVTKIYNNKKYINLLTNITKVVANTEEEFISKLHKNFNDEINVNNTISTHICIFCKSNNVDVKEVQLRSADEGATLMGHCFDCNRKFTF